MKKIKDFIYNSSDIFLTILVVALASGIIGWRIQTIMAYSGSASAGKTEQEIDIDFSGIDLTPSENQEKPSENPQTKPGDEDKDPETAPEPEKPSSEGHAEVDENFYTNKEFYVSIQPGCNYEKAIRSLAEGCQTAMGLTDDEYMVLFDLLWNRGVYLEADTRVQVNNFIIPSGSSITDMISIICGL